MDIGHVLRDILVVLVAAKVAAELAERVGIPAVVGEIVAGILIGPSLLGLVGETDDVLRTLGEIGVILLLLDVGLEMDLGELGKVGRASFLVATVGVVAPLVLGIGAMGIIGADFKVALFVGAALTATSVGITARVFGDLRALATTEARIVLGAAVADDVMGLVVLTVVVRLVTEGSVSVLSVLWIVLIAVAFLVLGGLIGLRVAPPLFAMVDRVSRSTGTMVAIALAFTLGFAEVANAAQLAPIVGAFVAGIALSRSEQSDRVRRELTPVGHLFIPVFFLQIGIDADVGAFGRAEVLRDAALLLVAAVIGKVVSPLGAIGTSSDKPLIGLGMLPRGEVGLIFATIGLQEGVLGDDLYASLLLVVLVTTLATPQLLKLRYTRLRRRARAEAPAADAPPPPGGWLEVVSGDVGLRELPPDELALPLALEAAIVIGRNRPRADLLDWLSSLPDDEPLSWDSATLELLLDVVERGNARSWRFLESTGVLHRALPELAAALRERADDPFSLDVLSGFRFRSMERLRALDADDPLALEVRALPNVDHLLLGALLVESLEATRDPVRDARRVLHRLGVDHDTDQIVIELVSDRDLMWSASNQPGGLGEEAVLQLASYLATPERARMHYVLSALRDEDRERWESERLRQLHELVQVVLTDPQLTGSDATTVDGARRQEALALVGDRHEARERVRRAPRSYVLRGRSELIARHAQLIDPLPSLRHAKVELTQIPGDGWRIDVVARDRSGLLAAVTGALADAGLDVDDALIATWDDGAAIESFYVRQTECPDAARITAAIEEAFGAKLSSVALAEAEVEFDSAASPWHTVCEVRSIDRPGLLHSLATAFAASGIDVLSANVTADNGLVIDRFELTNRRGEKLDHTEQATVRGYVRAGVTPKRRGRLARR